MLPVCCAPRISAVQGCAFQEFHERNLKSRRHGRFESSRANFRRRTFGISCDEAVPLQIIGIYSQSWTRHSERCHADQFDTSYPLGVEEPDEGISFMDQLTCESNEVKSMQFMHVVSVHVPAPLDFVWQLWTDLESAPHWMRWIDRVEVISQDEAVQSSSGQPRLKSLSRWLCSTPGFEVAWVARIEKIEVTPTRCILQWATIKGLHSIGEVSFTSAGHTETAIELMIRHSLPSALGRLLTSYSLQNLVHATLRSDLDRFQQYAVACLGKLQTRSHKEMRLAFIKE